MKIKTISLAISFAVSALSPHTMAKNADIEVIQVTGTYFNDYQVDNASGAMRTNTSLLETAQSVTVIPETIIDEQLATTLGEVLVNDASLSPGSKQRNREVFISRGFELSSSNGYLRDGHQHWSHYQQPIETLSHVEVIKGPSSALYGQSAPGGLVNMVTKKPTQTSLFDFGADTDQNGSTRFMLDAGGSIADKLSYRSVLVKQDVVYDREYANGESRERDRFLGYLAIDYTMTEDLVINVYYDQTNDKAGLDTGAWLDSNGDVIGSTKDIYDFSWAFTDITVENIGTKIDYFINSDWQVTFGYNEQTFERQRFESAPKKPSDYVVGDSYTSAPYDRFDDWQFKTMFFDVKGELEIGDTQHNLLIGANSLDYYYGQLRVKSSPVDYVPGDVEPSKPGISYKTDDSLYTSEYEFYGFYFQDLITINDHWQVALGGRVDRQNKENADSDSFVPKAGVLYHPIENATIYLNYSEGFEPQQSETLNDDTDKNHGMDLEAVTSEQIEIGVKWQVSDRLMLESAVFDIEKSGVLVTESLIDDPTHDTITTQAGLQRHKGVELSAQGAITDTLFIMASTMYLDATFERDSNYEGKTPMDAPQWSASVWSRYELTQSLALNAGLLYQGERYADNNNNITKDSYYRLDLGATYTTKISDHDVDFRLNVENALDEDYLAGGGVNNVTVGDERSARFEIKVSI
ncbi:TonB-dependent receptor [Thalassotalea atypica]|uniref:TonB-dependent receptor n=1 Tax=Thalassotalea atypica TaxID=2054316 RepID=UPI0025726A68|nr:TonB-dependent receptor [Thalassotalea atypica]